MESCECNVFIQAVRDEFIKKPGDRLPCTQRFSEKYFITKYDELRRVNYFMHIEFCPYCRGKVQIKRKSND